MFDKSVDNNPHALKFLPDCYKTQIMWNEAIKDYPSAVLYLITWKWLVCYKQNAEKPDNSIFSNDNIFYHDVDSNIIIFLKDDLTLQALIILTLMMMMIGFKMIQKLSTILYLWLGIINLNNLKHVKKETNEKLMAVAWHQTKW